MPYSNRDRPPTTTIMAVVSSDWSHDRNACNRIDEKPTASGGSARSQSLPGKTGAFDWPNEALATKVKASTTATPHLNVLGLCIIASSTRLMNEPQNTGVGTTRGDSTSYDAG